MWRRLYNNNLQWVNWNEDDRNKAPVCAEAVEQQLKRQNAIGSNVIMAEW